MTRQKVIRGDSKTLPTQVSFPLYPTLHKHSVGWYIRPNSSSNSHRIGTELSPHISYITEKMQLPIEKILFATLTSD